MHSIVFEDLALNDVEEAKNYYNTINPKLANKFQHNLSLVVNLLVSNPNLYQKRMDDSRFAKVMDFPYVVVYVIEQETIIVDVVFNTYQNPDKLEKLL